MHSFLATFEPVTVEDYPYGYSQRTSARFSVEKTSKGFRSVSETLNPKTSKWNKPKKSTYSAFVRPYKDESGHIKFAHFNPYNIEGYENAKASGIFDGITPDVFDHEKAMNQTLLIGIHWMTNFRGFEVNGHLENPIEPPKLSPEDMELLKNHKYEDTRKVYERIEALKK